MKIEKEKIGKLLNRKIILGVGALLSCLGVIAVCSFVPFIIDPTRWQTIEFLTDELIICAIVIFAMVATMFVGQASNAQNDKSNLAKARAAFFESVKKITNRSAFCQWVKKVLQPRDIETIKERELKKVGVEDLTVLSLEHQEIKSLLETPQKYGERFYKGMSQEQIDAVLKIKDGKYKFNLVEPDYYLSVKNLIDTRTISERSSKEGLKKGLYLARSIIGKLVLTIVSAMIFASLMRDLATDPDVATSLQKFLSRVWAMMSSAFMGFMVGTQINDIDAEYIEMRISVQEMYLQDKNFKALDQQEEAKKEFIDRVKGEGVLKLEHKEQ